MLYSIGYALGYVLLALWRLSIHMMPRPFRGRYIGWSQMRWERLVKWSKTP